MRRRSLVPALALVVLAGLAAPAGLAAAPRDVLAARVEVLQELAAEGVVAAYDALAGLARRYPGLEPFQGRDPLGYLAASAASGRASSMRWLAYRLLERSGPEPEAVRLLAMAAVMGDARARIDLRLWPKVTAVPVSMIAPAFEAALQRLARGQVLDCAALPVECPEAIDELTSLEPEAVLDASTLQKRGPYRDADAVYAVFEEAYQRYDAFPDSRYRAFLAKQEAMNEARRAAQASKDVGEGQGVSTAQQDREAMRREAARDYLRSTLSGDLQRHGEALRQALERVNRHREPSQRIEADELRRWIQEARD